MTQNFTPQKFRFLAAFGLLSLLAFGLFGCGSDNSLGPGSNTTALQRVYNALVGGGNIDVRQRTSATAPFASNVAFGSFSSYATTPTGNGINTFVFPAGTTATRYLQGSYDVDPNGNYTAVVYGVKGSTADATMPRFLRLFDNPNISVLRDAAGNALQFTALRIVHVAPGTATPITVFNGSNGATPIANLHNIAYGSASSTDDGRGYVYLPITAGQTSQVYTLSLGNDAGNQIYLTTPALTLNSGFAYTLVIQGSADATLGQALSVGLVQDYPKVL